MEVTEARSVENPVVRTPPYLRNISLDGCGVVLASQGQHLSLDLWKLGVNLYPGAKHNMRQAKRAAERRWRRRRRGGVDVSARALEK